MNPRRLRLVSDPPPLEEPQRPSRWSRWSVGWKTFVVVAVAATVVGGALAYLGIL